MSDENNRASWRAVPAALTVGLVLAAVVELSQIVVRLVSDERFSPAASVANIANDVALMPLLAIGAFRLARGLQGASASGARVFGAACFGMLGLSVYFLGAMVVSTGPGNFPEILWTLGTWLWPCVGITMAIGIAMLAGARVHVLVIVAAVLLVLIGYPIPLIVKPLFEAFGHEKILTVEQVARVGFFILAFVIAVASRPVCRSGFAVVSGHGLRYIGRALWLRIIAAVVLTGLPMVMFLSGVTGALFMFTALVLVAAMVNLVAQVWFAVGALQATHEDLPQYATSLAGACALWTAGVGLVQIMFMTQGFRRDFSDRASDYTNVLPYLTPIIATLGVAAIIVAITGLARRRGLEPLRQAASVRGIAYIALSLGVLAVQFAGYREIHSHGGKLLVTLASAVAGLIALAIVSRLCGMAADELESGPTLPTARLR